MISWTAACQAFLSVTVSPSLLKFMSIESVMPSNHLILCCPLFLPLIFPSLRVFSNESALHIRRLQHQSCLHYRPGLFFPMAYLFIWGMQWVFFAFAQVFFSSCGKQGLLFVAGHGSRALRLNSCGTGGSVAHRHVESSRTSDQTCVACIDR